MSDSNMSLLPKDDLLHMELPRVGMMDDFGMDLDAQEFKRENGVKTETPKQETDTTQAVGVEDHVLQLSEDEPAPDPARVRQTHAVVVPLYASWFNMRKIHQIERELLPEFFSTLHPLKLPKIYASYRNFMINTYRLNPNEYLTLTLCRRNLVGDVGTLMRVHRFLNKWGLINYQVNPQFKPAYALEKLPNGLLAPLPYTGDFHVQYDTPRGLFPFDTFKVSPLDVHAPTVKRLLQEPQANGKRAKTEGDWTAQELAKLATAVKEHKNDWFAVGRAVGRSALECAVRFLQLPLGHEASDAELGILRYAANFPVAAADNPVISNLIFMTQLVDADVVRAAAGRAAKAIEPQEDADAQLEPEGDPERVLQDSATAVLGAVGARSHLFANYEEREMHRLSTTLVARLLAKIDAKLAKIKELELLYQRERQNLARLQSEVFVDRLALTRLTVHILRKLSDAAALLRAKGTDTDDVAALLNEVQGLLFKPHRQEVEEKPAPKADTEEKAPQETVKPWSVETPQAFKVWAP